MVKQELYCRRCDASFNISAKTPLCPQCGERVAPWLDAATQEMTGTIEEGNERGYSPDDALVGTRLGNYEIEAFLGEGGMARVYRATHLTLERVCAIKVLSPTGAGTEAAVESLLVEARAAASLVHPHAVTLYTIGHDRNYHYLEMEFVDGQSLAHLVRSEGPLPATQATRLMVQVSSALAQAHSMGMIHRDIKPSNVMVTCQGEAKLSDFGLAQRHMANAETSGLRVAMGTPYYMAPELFQGTPAGPRSDVYAMGVMYFTLLTGRVPIGGRSVNELMKTHAKKPEIDLAELVPSASESVRLVLRRCLAPLSESRYEDAKQLFGELRAAYGSLRDLSSLLKESLVDEQVTVEGSGEQFEVSVALDGGRSQRVYVQICRGGAVSDEVIEIYSVCGPVCDRYLRRALELNARIPHGSIAIQTVEDEPHFVMSNAYPRATCDPEEIRSSVLTIARHADQVELLLTGQDLH